MATKRSANEALPDISPLAKEVTKATRKKSKSDFLAGNPGKAMADLTMSTATSNIDTATHALESVREELETASSEIDRLTAENIAAAKEANHLRSLSLSRCYQIGVLTQQSARSGRELREAWQEQRRLSADLAVKDETIKDLQRKLDEKAKEVRLAKRDKDLVERGAHGYFVQMKVSEKEKEASASRLQGLDAVSRDVVASADGGSFIGLGRALEKLKKALA